MIVVFIIFSPIFDEIEAQKELGQFTQDEVQEPETTQEV